MKDLIMVILAILKFTGITGGILVWALIILDSLGMNTDL